MSASDIVKTVKVEAKKTSDNPSGYVIINASDFDAKTMKEYTGPDFDPATYAAEQAEKPAVEPAVEPAK